MATQLLQKFDRPGDIGASAQWIHKLLARFTCLQDEGKTLFEKSVICFYL